MFQKNVRFRQGFGLVGEIRFDGPHRAGTFTLATAGDEATVLARNTIGHVFTFVDGEPGFVAAGGTGVFAGILANPKVYAYRGSVANSGESSAALFVPNGIAAEFLTMGFITVAVDKAAAVGDYLTYNTTTGAISVVARPADGSVPAAPAGYALIPNAYVDRYPQDNAAGGLVLARLTN